MFSFTDNARIATHINPGVGVTRVVEEWSMSYGVKYTIFGGIFGIALATAFGWIKKLS